MQNKIYLKYFEYHIPMNVLHIEYWKAQPLLHYLSEVNHIYLPFVIRKYIKRRRVLFQKFQKSILYVSYECHSAYIYFNSMLPSIPFYVFIVAMVKAHIQFSFEFIFCWISHIIARNRTYLTWNIVFLTIEWDWVVFFPCGIFSCKLMIAEYRSIWNEDIFTQAVATNIH